MSTVMNLWIPYKFSEIPEYLSNWKLLKKALSSSGWLVIYS
jgi:hypothetical protein